MTDREKAEAYCDRVGITYQFENGQVSRPKQAIDCYLSGIKAECERIKPLLEALDHMINVDPMSLTDVADRLAEYRDR